ncbi:MAG: YkgJ family cysteine cluster protein [Deltaproteobacteria bacterium]|nr:YkgJ family cysteine cluster protein [Deltaproteobacteria bacterium]
MEHTLIPLSLDDTFKFSCNAGVLCFNECCKDVNQFLTPYDVLRLKRHFGISSGEFLEKYTTQHVGPETGLPVVCLKTDPADGFTCPFVSPEGCRVYDSRPSSCRTYPLARMLSRSRETGQITIQYGLLVEPHCLGHEQDRQQSVREWIASQGIAPYDAMNDRMMDIISLKNRLIPGALDLKSRHLFSMACYDLDAFRKYLTDNFSHQHLGLNAESWQLLLEDDVELLKFSLNWLKQALFGALMHP